MKLIIPIATALLCALALAAAGCSPAAPGSADASDAGTSQGQPAGDAAVESTAMVVILGNGQVLFIDQDTETPYYPTLPADAPEMTTGDIVRVLGNGIMLESYPGQYPGIAQVEITTQGTAEDARRYDEIIAPLWQPRDPAQPPSASLEYRTDLAIVTLSPCICSYTWTFDDQGEQRTLDDAAVSATDCDRGDLPAASLDQPVEVSATFEEHATAIEIVRLSEDDLHAGSQNVEHEQGVFTAEPGWRYIIRATFAQGAVVYAFTA